eukprot:04742.XXX_255467_255697_1 [CDS] Oithona nana genome sequencing.
MLTQFWLPSSPGPLLFGSPIVHLVKNTSFPELRYLNVPSSRRSVIPIQAWLSFCRFFSKVTTRSFCKRLVGSNSRP